MKRNIKIFITILIIFASCSKESGIESSNDLLITNGKVLLQKITNMADDESIKLAYSNLTSQERLSLWIAKLTIKIDSYKGSSVKANKLAEIKDYLNIDVFKEGEKREIFYNAWFVSWMVDAQKIFSVQELNENVFTLTAQELLLTKKLNQGSSTKNTIATCRCALNSGWTCYFTGPWGIPTWHECLNKYLCKETARGCGALGDNECDGSTCDFEDHAA